MRCYTNLSTFPLPFILLILIVGVGVVVVVVVVVVVGYVCRNYYADVFVCLKNIYYY